MESVELLNEILNSFFIREDLLDSGIGNGLSLPIAPITSQVAPTIKGLVSSSNETEKRPRFIKIIKQQLYILNFK